MSDRCKVCDGSGILLHEICPLCDGDPRFGENLRDYFVFVLAGQSNMVGRGTATELDQSLIDFVHANSDARMAYDIDKSAKEQKNTTSENEFVRLERETQWSDGGQCYSHGPEWGIAQRVIERLIRRHAVSPGAPAGPTLALRPRIYFIKFAMGSTSLSEDWSPDGLYFAEFVQFTRTMLQRVAELEHTEAQQCGEEAACTTQNPAATIDGLFWNQGDSDASGRSEMRDNYETNFVNFVRRVWMALAGREGTFPFVALQLHWKVDENSKSTKRYRRSMEKVNQAIRNGCKALGSSTGMAEISPELEVSLASMCYDDGHSGTSALAIEGQLLVDVFVGILESQRSGQIA